MRVLFVTWDGAGNLPPALSLITALVARGHQIDALGHNSQRAELTTAGAEFRAYPHAPQIDQSRAQPGFDFMEWFRTFNQAACADFLALAHDLQPDILVIDSMMGASLAGAWSTGIKLVALVHATYSFMAPWKDSLDAADLILNCSYEAFDVGTKFPRKMLFVGPLRSAPGVQTGAHSIAWSRKHPDLPLVVASLSTGIQGPFQLGLLERIANALATLPVEAVLTTGRGIAPSDLTALLDMPNAPNLTIARVLDHTATLPQASLFITHAGHGSVMAALRAGVPMLCLPPIVDQPHNARLVAELGLGELLDVMAPPADIAAAATRILGDRKLQKSAKKFAKKKTFAPRLDEAVKAIEKLVR